MQGMSMKCDVRKQIKQRTRFFFLWSHIQHSTDFIESKTSIAHIVKRIMLEITCHTRTAILLPECVWELYIFYIPFSSQLVMLGDKIQQRKPHFELLYHLNSANKSHVVQRGLNLQRNCFCGRRVQYIEHLVYFSVI